MTPGFCRPEAQQQFIDEYRQLRTFEGSGVEVISCDAMHLLHQVNAAFYWGRSHNRVTLLSNSARQRLNILGGYNPRNQQLIHLSDESSCNAQKAIRFFEKLLEAYPEAHTIVVILDNAPYFRAKILKQWFKRHPRLTPCYLPTYCPHLNIIQRLWKLAKAVLVNNCYYEKYKTFRAYVFRFLNHIDHYQEKLDSLMVEKFPVLHKNRA